MAAKSLLLGVLLTCLVTHRCCGIPVGLISTIRHCLSEGDVESLRGIFASHNTGEHMEMAAILLREMGIAVGSRLTAPKGLEVVETALLHGGTISEPVYFTARSCTPFPSNTLRWHFFDLLRRVDVPTPALQSLYNKDRTLQELLRKDDKVLGQYLADIIDLLCIEDEEGCSSAEWLKDRLVFTWQICGLSETQPEELAENPESAAASWVLQHFPWHAPINNAAMDFLFQYMRADPAAFEGSLLKRAVEEKDDELALLLLRYGFDLKLARVLAKDNEAWLEELIAWGRRNRAKSSNK